MVLRQKKILELLSEREDISVNELSNLLKVTEVTIRTDLNSLAHQKKVIRMHGRAQLLDERIKAENTFEVRKKQNYAKKLKIGKVAAQLVNSNETILLDSSSTVLTLATALRDRKEIKEVTAIPTGIWTSIELMNNGNLNILVPGGYLRSASGSITGLPTRDFLKDLNIKKAFLGAWGISLEKGYMDSHLLEIELKKYIIGCADDIIILADGSKFEQEGLASYAEIDGVSTLITDNSAPESVISNIEKKGINVICVN